MQPFTSPLHDVMSVLVSVAVLTAALFVILSNRYDDATKKWAYGVAGLVIGFWLKG